MTDAPTNTPAGGTPGTPAINPAPPPPELNRGGSFVRERAAQMAEKMQQPAPGTQPEADAQQQQQRQQAPPAEQKIRVGDAEYEAQAVSDALAFKAEQDVRRQNLPKADTDYQVRNSENFRLPEGITGFEFDMKDPTLAAARKFALDRGLDQETFSGMLDLFVASKTGELMNQAKLRETNMAQLGAAGPSRIDAVATWLSAKAGKDGAAVAGFIKQFPSAPLVRALENIVRQFSNQGGADFSQQHRAQEDTSGKIPGYDNMSFAQKRAAQMAQMMSRPGYRGGGSRNNNER
jgi:hypothetical protein